MVEQVSKAKVVRTKSGKWSFAFESFGVKVSVTAADKQLAADVLKLLTDFFPAEYFRSVPIYTAGFRFRVGPTKNWRFVMYRGRRKITSGNDRAVFVNFLCSMIRITVAEFAAEHVFLHAGVVGWKGRALIFPANSFQGKTTLIKELVKIGAIYYSDEYAVIDRFGLVHPFAKDLSVRGIVDDFQQTEVPVESFGGVRGLDPIPLGAVCLTEFSEGSIFEPVQLSLGRGILEMLPFTIPATFNPEFSMKVLNNAASRAIIFKTKRGEAKDFAVKLLSFFEKQKQ